MILMITSLELSGDWARWT